MSTFTDPQISAWSFRYEAELCAKYDLIADRISLPIVSGRNEYQIPNYVSNIRSVLYLGKEIYAKGGRSSVITNDTPGETAGGTPFEYVYSNKGLRVLKFFPTPMDNIALYTQDLWTPAADQAAVIVEFYRTSTAANPIGPLNLPPWLRQYLLKDYVCWKSAMVEGKGQDSRMANYYQKRLDDHAEYIRRIKGNMNRMQHAVLSSDPSQTGRRKPGRPVLPPNFGYPVNW